MKTILSAITVVAMTSSAFAGGGSSARSVDASSAAMQESAVMTFNGSVNGSQDMSGQLAQFLNVNESAVSKASGELVNVSQDVVVKSFAFVTNPVKAMMVVSANGVDVSVEAIQGTEAYKAIAQASKAVANFAGKTAKAVFHGSVAASTAGGVQLQQGFVNISTGEIVEGSSKVIMVPVKMVQAVFTSVTYDNQMTP